MTSKSEADIIVRRDVRNLNCKPKLDNPKLPYYIVAMFFGAIAGFWCVFLTVFAMIFFTRNIITPYVKEIMDHPRPKELIYNMYVKVGCYLNNIINKLNDKLT